MNFLKVHGLGNDFVLVDARVEKEIPESPENLSGLAVSMCDRKFGVGADGLVIIRECEDADIYMRIINSDGSEAEMCGNAIRCVARYLYDQAGEARLRIKTPAGIMVPEIITCAGRVKAVRVDMGEPLLERDKIPMAGPPGLVVDELLEWEGTSFRVTAVSMGNPHCVIFVDNVHRVPLDIWGPGIESHPAFPRKVNVEFVEVLGRDEAAIRVWERGAGATMACGTGACAAAVACYLNGRTGRKVKINVQAGSLDIEWKEDNNRVYMTGPAEVVFRGEYPVK